MTYIVDQVVHPLVMEGYAAFERWPLLGAGVGLACCAWMIGSWREMRSWR